MLENKSLRDILILLAYWAFFLWPVAAVFVVERVHAKRKNAMIQAAKDMELEPGVTLSRAVRAYFGQDGDWGVAQGLVFVFAGGSGRPMTDLRVNLDRGELILYQDGREWSRARAAALAKAMVRAAQGQDPDAW